MGSSITSFTSDALFGTGKASSKTPILAGAKRASIRNQSGSRTTSPPFALLAMTFGTPRNAGNKERKNKAGAMKNHISGTGAVPATFCRALQNVDAVAAGTQ